MSRLRTRIAVVSLLALALVPLSHSGVWAKGKAKAAKVKPAVTKMHFALADHEVLVGEEVTGTVTVSSRGSRSWSALSGASLSVRVDGVVIDTVTTGTNGRAVVSYTTETAGSHSIKVVYAGDATHKKSQRAQGFEALSTWYADADADGYGDADVSADASEQPEGYVADGTDCDDADAAVNPGATETADNVVDDDCDGEVDEIEQVDEAV